MAWTAKQIYDLDNSMVAAQNIDLGTLLSAITGLSAGAGFHAVTAAEDSASALHIDSASGETIVAWDVRIFTSGSYIAAGDYRVLGLGGSVLNITSASLTAGDVVIYNIY